MKNVLFINLIKHIRITGADATTDTASSLWVLLEHHIDTMTRTQSLSATIALVIIYIVVTLKQTIMRLS